MKGLLVKDLRLVAKQKKLLFLMLLMVVLFTFSSKDATLTATLALLLLSMLTLNTLSYDEMNGGMLFLLSLPVNRKTYVKEKYVFAVLNLMVAAVVSVITCYVASIVKNEANSVGDIILNTMGILFMMGLMIAVALPLVLKYGAEKGRILVGVVMGLIIIVAAVVYAIVTVVLHFDVIGSLAKLLGGVSSEELLYVILVGGILVVLLLVLFCSYLISNRIMRKKEF